MSETTQPPQPVILLIEPDLAMRERFYDLLRRRGYIPIAVSSPEQAIDMLKHERPDVVLATATLTRQHAAELVTRIRSFDVHLPMIVLNGSPEGPWALAQQASAVRVISGGVSDDVLLNEIGHALQRPRAPRHQRWPGTILVVDDELKLQRLLEDFLHLQGLTVTAVSSGEEALNRLARSPEVAVVLLDIKMPGMDGLLTLKKIKAARPAVTVIVMTALDDDEAMRDALALGAYDYILKPFSLEYLETILLSKLLAGPAP